MSSPYRLTLAVTAALVVAACAPLTTAELPATAQHPVLAATAASWPEGDGDGQDPARVVPSDDPQLNALVRAALAANPTLIAARAHARAAQAVAAGQRSALLPSFGVKTDAGREQISANGMFPKPFGGQTFSLIELAASLTYRLDLSGISHARASSQAAEAAAVDEQSRGAASSIAGQVARLYYGLAAALEDRAELERLQQGYERGRQLDRTRARAGLETEAAAHRSSAQAESFRADLAAIDETIERQREMIAALMGVGPDATHTLVPAPLSAAAGMALPRDFRVGLLGRRAAIRGARDRVEAAAFNRAAAHRAYVPDLDFSTFLGLQSRSGSNLVNTGSREWSVGPALSLPVFDGGLRASAIRVEEAEYEAARADYERVVLQVVDEVSSALTVRRATAAELTAAVAARDDEAKAAAAIERRYRAGIATEMDALAAQAHLIARERDVIRLTARARTSDVDLFEALGGAPREEKQP
jgi:NodT family efflux transporter outer membrane factor (OMF) lipoprotein